MQNWHKTESYAFFKKAIRDNIDVIIWYCGISNISQKDTNNILKDIYKITAEKNKDIKDLSNDEFKIKYIAKKLNNISNLDDKTLNDYKIINNRFDKDFHFTNDEIKQNVKAEFKDMFIYVLKECNININNVVNDYSKVNKALNDMNDKGIIK